MEAVPPYEPPTTRAPVVLEIIEFDETLIFPTSGHVAIGGWDNIAVLKSADLFPLPACSINSVSCSIPDLPEPRLDHSLSLLPGGRLVVCGGRNFDYESGRFFTLDTCLSWVAGNNIWTDFSTMR